MSDRHDNINPDVKASHPFHRGEIAVQNKLGVDEIRQWVGDFVYETMPEQHHIFYGGLPFLIAALRDQKGLPWVTMLSGPPGFAATPDPKHLSIQSLPNEGDALGQAFFEGNPVGLLGIEPATRRRNRVNGVIARNLKDSFLFEVTQAFGNCPKYIRPRNWTFTADHAPHPAQRETRLNDKQARWISEADTFFIGTGTPPAEEEAFGGMDASHRGGPKGFVEVMSDKLIRFPDYSGNNFYNTIGNLMLDNRAGLLFADFETGSLLQLSGRVSIDWDSPAVEKTPGALKLLIFHIDHVVEQPGAVALRWKEEEEALLSLKLLAKRKESEQVTSFYLGSQSGAPLPPFKPGQHLPLELKIPGTTLSLSREYSLSGPQDLGCYRISVKREEGGVGSNYLHDHFEPGQSLQSYKPSGDFTLPETGPVTLISAGVGITPMMAALHTLIRDPLQRPVHFIHIARNGRSYPFREEIEKLATLRDDVRTTTVLTRPDEEDTATAKHDFSGRLSAPELADLVGNRNSKIMLCGPAAFMQQLRAALQNRGFADSAVLTENFGSS
ncbi:FAD-binding oxidoreductase [Kiloniella sp. b19]|uniref:FAD-binding oxidoreductase n=1 Tax=Kiloniella sp. GXU_MW_B19 TaxID=3141326 RepID=UPI0031CF0DAE